ncbi:hypothetical protein [Pseudomonas aeruginosa]|uniref:hypothetical protein n=1 Tax=Pseudomonas aeruginosa TaxID=287 RepID=UPI0032B37A5A
MKNLVIGTLLATQFVLPIYAFAEADDADTHRDRSRKIGDMEYKRDQLKLQAEMADSYKKMSDAGFIVDESGSPLGVTDIATLGKEVCKAGSKSDKADLPFGQNPVIPNAAPFMLDQPTLGMSGPNGQTAPGGPVQPGPSQKSVPDDDEDKAKHFLALLEVRADSIVVMTSQGRRIVRNGEKVNDYTLQRFGLDKAVFKGPDGTRELVIDWTKSKRYADD